MPQDCRKVELEREVNADRLPGAKASQLARLVLLIALCGFQYWLLASTMEAYHAGNPRVAVVALVVSLACFALGAGLVITGEISLRKLNSEMRQEGRK